MNMKEKAKQMWSKLMRNWFVHNMFGHPACEITLRVGRLITTDEKAHKWSAYVHGLTVPPKGHDD